MTRSGHDAMTGMVADARMINRIRRSLKKGESPAMIEKRLRLGRGHVARLIELRRGLG